MKHKDSSNERFNLILALGDLEVVNLAREFAYVCSDDHAKSNPVRTRFCRIYPPFWATDSHRHSCKTGPWSRPPGRTGRSRAIRWSKPYWAIMSILSTVVPWSTKTLRTQKDRQHRQHRQHMAVMSREHQAHPALSISYQIMPSLRVLLQHPRIWSKWSKWASLTWMHFRSWSPVWRSSSWISYKPIGRGGRSCAWKLPLCHRHLWSQSILKGVPWSP